MGLFGGKAQVVVGSVCFAAGGCFWLLGTFIIEGADRVPWRWTPVAFVFHVSMFYGQVACYAIIATGLGFRATERVETAVASGEASL